MEWSNYTLNMLISEHRARKYLSDTTNYFYKVHSEKKDAWGEIGRMFGCDASEAKQKGFTASIIRP
jgi:hypothetical protein